jgi:hypothetical protein
MKRLLLLLTIVSMFTAASFAQSPIGKGGKQVNFGLGFGSDLPAYVGVDFGVHDDITVGPLFAIDLNGLDWLTIAAKSDYHFNTLLNIPQEWDFYAGLNLGFRAGLGGGNTSGLQLGAQVGGRWYWNDRWGLNLEFGGGIAFAGGSFGLSVKL